MSRIPPLASSRLSGAPGRPRRVLDLAMAAAIAAGAAGCGSVVPLPDSVAPSAASPGSPTPASRSTAGLLVAAGGALFVTDTAGSIVRFDGPTAKIRSVSAAAGRVVAATTDGDLLVSDPPAIAPTARAWRALAAAVTDRGRSPIAALSHDGGRLATVSGGPEMATLELRIVDVVTGEAAVHQIELSANGAIAWIDGATLALEVLGKKTRGSPVATVDVTTWRATERQANLLSMSCSADGRRLAAIDVVSGLPGVHDTTDWLNGEAAGDPPLPIPEGSFGDAIALSAAGDRIAIVVLDPDGRRSLILAAFAAGRWDRIAMIRPPDANAISIAWLE
jgi:hypothetical protein